MLVIRRQFQVWAGVIFLAEKHCFDGSDELNCWQLKMKECAENKYRRYTDQYIPLKVFGASPMNSYCLDRVGE
jgi:hypothetical protein